MMQTTTLQWMRLASFNALPLRELNISPAAVMLSSLFAVKSRGADSARRRKIKAAQPRFSVCIAGTPGWHIGGDGDNLLVSFTSPSEAGWVLHMSTDYPSIELPESYAVPQGMYNVLVPFVSSPVDTAADAMISVSLNGQTVMMRIRVLPQR